VAGKAWFPYFRLYGPTEAHFDGKWVLPDIEKVQWFQRARPARDAGCWVHESLAASATELN